MKENLVAIVGPTAVGKTELSIKLAQLFRGEVISGDSMQVYRGMDIGTAKVTKEEMDNIPHHLVDIKEPTESFSVAEFQEQAIPLISNINARGKTPFLVGGTGLYVNAVTHHFMFADSPSDPNYREELEQFVTEHGAKALHCKLEEIDPVTSRELHPNNYRRVIRALEVYKLTGKTLAEFRQEQKQQTPYNLVMIGLTMEREVLYDRINRRVDRMIEQGLLEEARSLYKSGVRNCQSVQAIGYKEVYEFLEGHVSLTEAIEMLKRNSRRYAKRQLTWFRNKADVTWFDMTNGLSQQKFQEMKDLIEGKLKEKAK
ncbi:tRNA (adenosine(37)-N6)-dimethylallyltransferase MiaA [Halalkalibacterium ligniniphilum]|uniref:tRNA (adenosine(37)-N6)-dimethylallyltransferase MiaA n=1 Tax=Halalkalibacterium ligniniphilum TaxID=1134413 RepID=UPI00034D4A2F|nr:tRNA (adenosine(37)-N6)-dimethylallyltransferase MiaA [Halalkalibacterium ligniniphilum]